MALYSTNSRRQLGRVVCLVVALTFLNDSMASQSASATIADYEVPPVCGGRNPVSYLGIDSAGGSQRDAEHSLGLKLNDLDFDIVRIYTTLQYGNTVFAPGHCPGMGLEPESHMPQPAVPLAFVFSRQTAFARTFLSVKSNARFYSLGLLVRRVAWRAADNQTLKLAVSPDNTSQQCWEASNEHQRKAFIHWLVHRQINDIAVKTNRGLRRLEGKLLFRVESQVDWPLSSSGFTYELCRHSLLPRHASVADVSNLTHTVCSHWSSVQDRSVASFETGARYLLIVTTAVFLFLFNINTLLQYIRLERDFRLQPYSVWFRISDKPAFKLGSPTCGPDAGFPSKLSVAPLFRTLELSQINLPLAREHGAYMAILAVVLRFYFRFLHRPVFYRVLLWAAAWLAIFWLLVIEQERFSQPFDISNGEKQSCEERHSDQIIQSSIHTCFTVLGSFIVIIVAPMITSILQEMERKSKKSKCSSGAHCAALIAHALLTHIAWYALYITGCVYFFGVVHELLVILFFSVIGILIYYQVPLLLTIGLVQVYLIDVLKLGRINEAQVPEIAECTRACEIAVRHLREDILSEHSIAQSNHLRTSAIEPLHVKPNLSRCSSLKSASIDGYATDGSARRIPESFDFCLTRAFLILCVESRLVTPWRTGTPLTERVDRALEQRIQIFDQFHREFYKDIWNELRWKVFRRFRKYLHQAVLGGILMTTLLINVGFLLGAVSELSPSLYSWSNFIIPAFILIQGLVQYLQYQRRDDKAVHGGLVVQAKEILLKLLQQTGHDGCAQHWLRDDGSIHVRGYLPTETEV